MNNDFTPMTEDEIHHITLTWLKERGVTLDAVAELVYILQHTYFPDITLSECLEHVQQVLTKREVQNAVMTGIQLDRLAEQRLIKEPLLDIIRRDEGLYGIDETLATAILNVYGSIGMTNFGYIDRVKPLILSRLNNHQGSDIHTFLDDIVGAIAAAAAARLSHNRKHQQEAPNPVMHTPFNDNFLFFGQKPH
ncbi:phosphatidylglycerophosphatase A family protein [Marininema mesophilum]|nr:phosphatidylglycerophosphatase A [Marininema mesophilum]